MRKKEKGRKGGREGQKKGEKEKEKKIQIRSILSTAQVKIWI